MPLPRPPRDQRRWWVLGTLFTLVAVALATWYGLAFANQVQWQDVGYRVVDDRTVETTFEVYRPDGRATTCTLKAMDSGFGTVGTLDVTVPAGTHGTTRRSATIRTTSRAVTGVVDRCTQ